MMADAEILTIASSCLKSVGIKNFSIKINHRKLLCGAVSAAGVANEGIVGVCTTIDKADKLSEEELREELLNERKLDDQTCARILKLIKLEFGFDQLEKAKASLKEIFVKDLSEDIESAFSDLDLLFKYCQAYGTDEVCLALNLARGLDYYTGNFCTLYA